MRKHQLCITFGIILIALVSEVVAQETKPVVEQEVIERLQVEEWITVSITLEDGISSNEILEKLGNNFILENKDEFYDRSMSGKINQAGFNLIKDDDNLLWIGIPKIYNTGPALEIKKENNIWVPKILFLAFLLFVLYILWRKFYKKDEA